MALSRVAILGASFLLSVCVGLPLGGCATTAAQVSTVAILTDVAVARAVENGSPNAATQTARAVKIKAIATQLQALATGAAVSLPQIVSALTPLLAAAGLGGEDVLIAQALVSALEAVIAQYTANGANANTQTTIQLVLSDVIAACGAYGA